MQRGQFTLNCHLTMRTVEAQRRRRLAAMGTGRGLRLVLREWDRGLRLKVTPIHNHDLCAFASTLAHEARAEEEYYDCKCDCQKQSNQDEIPVTDLNHPFSTGLWSR